VSDRITHLTAAYEELLQLANERQSRLKEARKMWQFYDDVEDEEAWIKEKEQIMSSPDLGHDLTSIRLLLTKHKVLRLHLNFVRFSWFNFWLRMLCKPMVVEETDKSKMDILMFSSGL